jgi:hypothetical protein
MTAMEQVAAVLFGLLSLLVAAFQLALVLGAPWGEFTLGGRWRGSLPCHARLIALGSLVLLGAFVAVMAARAGLAFAALQPFAAPLAWVVVGYCVLGCIANAATPSRRERAVWLPVVLCMLGLSVVVATS